MAQIFGEFLEDFTPSHDSLIIIFTPSSAPIKKRWRNNRLSAHFIADYFSSFLPIDTHDDEREKRINASKSAVSYIANELLENAMKYNYNQSNYQVNIGVNFIQNQGLTAVIFSKNSVHLEVAKRFQLLIEELLSCNLEERYIASIEANAKDPDSEASGLGIVTIINDYSAKMGWKFEYVDDNPDVMMVTSMAQIIV